MNQGRILIIRSQDGLLSYVETIPDTKSPNEALKLKDSEIALLIEMLKQYHNGEINIINLTIDHS